MATTNGRSSRRDVVILTALVASALGFHLAFQLKEPLVYGIDGPYYLTQVRHIERTGTLKYGDPPLAFYLFFVLSALLGDRVLGVKLGTALSAALTVVPAYCLLRLEFRRPWPSALGALALAFSPQLLRLSCDFLKNLVGSLFLLTSLYFFALSLRGEGLRDPLISSAFLLLAGLTHSLAFAVNLALLVLYAGLTALTNRHKARLALRNLALALAVPVSVALIGLVVFPRFFSDILKGEAFLEELLSGESSPLLLLSPTSSVVLGLSCSGLVLGARGLRIHKPWAPLVLAASITGIALTCPLLPPQWAWRFALMGFVPVLVVLAALAQGAGDKLLGVAIAIAILVPLFSQTAIGAITWGPRITPAEYSDLLAMRELVPPGSVVIVHNMAVGYWAEYLFDCDLAKRFSPELFASYEHVLLLLRADRRPPPGPNRPIFRGEALALYELMPPPR